VGTYFRQPYATGPTSEALHKASLSERERAENGRFRVTQGKDNRNSNEDGRMRTVRRLTRECDLIRREIDWSQRRGKKRRNCEESPELNAVASLCVKLFLVSDCKYKGVQGFNVG